MKKLAASHVEDHQQSVQTEANNDKWDPQEMGSNEHTQQDGDKTPWTSLLTVLGQWPYLHCQSLHA
jgi:hypothetical protein